MFTQFPPLNSKLPCVQGYYREYVGVNRPRPLIGQELTGKVAVEWVKRIRLRSPLCRMEIEEKTSSGGNWEGFSQGRWPLVTQSMVILDQFQV